MNTKVEKDIPGTAIDLIIGRLMHDNDNGNVRCIDDLNEVAKIADWLLSIGLDEEAVMVLDGAWKCIPQVDTDTLICKLSVEFSRILNDWMTIDQLKEAVRLNKGESEWTICHTHDYGDANMVMDSAFKNVTGRPCCPFSETECHVWSEAWKRASQNEFQPPRQNMRFTVLITRDVTESCEVLVEAKNAEEARDRALDRASNGNLTWEFDEGNEYEPYVADPDNSINLVGGES